MPPNPEKENMRESYPLTSCEGMYVGYFLDFAVLRQDVLARYPEALEALLSDIS